MQLTSHTNDIQGTDLDDLYFLINILSEEGAQKHEHSLKNIDYWKMIMARDIVITIRDRDLTKRIVGIGLLVATTTPFPEHKIEGVVRHPDYSGCGIGEIIMKSLHTEAKRRNISELRLTSNPKRLAARSLYEKLGYELIGETGKFILTLDKDA